MLADMYPELYPIFLSEFAHSISIMEFLKTAVTGHDIHLIVDKEDIVSFRIVIYIRLD